MPRRLDRNPSPGAPPALSTSPSGRGGRSRGRRAYLAANGAILFFLLAPLVVVAVFALNPTPFIQFPPVGVTMRWFAKFFASPEFMGSLRLSLEVAGAVVVLATLIGAAAALALARGGLPGARVLTAVFLAPLMLPAILTGLALFQLFQLLGLGRPTWALVVGHTLVAVPYVMRTTLAVLSDFDRRIEEAAAILGASPARIFFEVTLPIIRPGVIAGGIFAFIVSFDQFPISLFLVTPGRETLPVVLFNYMKFDLDGAIAAASMVSILLALAVVVAIDRLVGLRATMRI
ncbi:MAG: ABC transporter permease [Microvirga sp.]